MAEAKFSVIGHPVPLQRPRVVTIGGYARAFTPKETVVYQELVKFEAIAARPFNWPTDKRYSVHIRVYWGDRRHRDLDNVQKTVADALQGIFWANDSQIFEWHAFKCVADSNPRIEVSVSTIEGVDDERAA